MSLTYKSCFAITESDSVVQPPMDGIFVNAVSGGSYGTVLKIKMEETDSWVELTVAANTIYPFAPKYIHTGTTAHIFGLWSGKTIHHQTR